VQWGVAFANCIIQILTANAKRSPCVRAVQCSTAFVNYIISILMAVHGTMRVCYPGRYSGVWNAAFVSYAGNICYG